MGSLLSCFSDAADDSRRRRKAPPPRRRNANSNPNPSSSAPGSSARWRSNTKRDGDSSLIDDQALAAVAAAMLMNHQNGGGAAAASFDRSSSMRYVGSGGKKQQGLARSSSSRARSLTDPIVQPLQLVVNQEEKVDNLETDRFVLVHGGGFGAWSWYKTIALLEDNGFKVTAIDLAGSGTDCFDSNNITSLAQYVKPLTSFLEKLGDGEKVILVGHDFGGACISFAMEAFPSTVAKAVFITAAMLTNGQSTLDMFSKQDEANDLMRQAQVFQYAKGNNHPPTAIDLDKSLLKDLLFNQSPAKDVALASVSMRSIPFAPVLEKLSLTEENYGSIRRFFIETTEDNAIPLSLQESMSTSNPPEKVFRLKGSDHSPFFSKPQALHKLLVEIAKLPPPPQREQTASNLEQTASDHDPPHSSVEVQL